MNRWPYLVVAAVVLGCTTPTTTPTTTAPTPTTVADTRLPSPTSAPPTSPGSAPASQPTPTTVEPNSWPQLVTLGEALGRFDSPVDMDQHPISGVMYVVEQDGRVQRIEVSGRRLDPPAIDLADGVRSGGEQGLLGLAFDPTGDRVFLNFTDTDGDTVVAAYAVQPDGIFAPESQQVLLRLDQPYRNHNGGEVLYGPDGALWVPTGDGGSAGDPQRVALDPTSLLGKLLRIDLATGAVEVWASGLRNPWRASFDTVTGDLWLADVGQGDWEEISVARADQDWARGRNFGWSAFEGTHRFAQDQPVEGHVPPVFEYAHGDQGCSVTGGVRYRGDDLPALSGAYVFADYCSGRIRALPITDDASVGTPVDLAQLPSVVAVRSDGAGEIWVVSLEGDLRPLISAGRP